MDANRYPESTANTYASMMGRSPRFSLPNTDIYSCHNGKHTEHQEFPFMIYKK